MKRPQSRLSRRNFLFAVGAGGAAVTAALVAQPTRNAKSPGEKNVTQSQGYHVTDHIRNYYRTAKV